MKNVRWYLCLASLSFLSLGIAHATPITYTLNDVSTNKGTVTGTVSIDNVTNLVTAVDLTYNDSTFGDPVLNQVGTEAVANGVGSATITGASNSPLNGGAQFVLYYDVASLATNNLLVCVHGQACGSLQNQGSYVQVFPAGDNGNGVQSFILAPTADVAPVPEPSSLALLGTGIFCIGGLMARMSGRTRKTSANLA